MNEINVIYQMLREKRRETDKKLELIKEKLSQELPVQQTIVIKRIKGKKYYYSQWKENGKLRTQYLCPVAPGAVAEQEEKLQRRRKLLEEQKEQLLIKKYLEQVLKQMEKDQKQRRIVEDYSFEVFWKDEVTARVCVQGKDVRVARYTEHPVKQLFADSHMTRHQLNRIFELRCWDRGRPDISELLGRFGLKAYNPQEIVRKTHGVSYNDYIWFRFPGEKLTSKDVLVR